MSVIVFLFFNIEINFRCFDSDVSQHLCVEDVMPMKLLSLDRYEYEGHADHDFQE